jgi:hypothetical protein
MRYLSTRGDPTERRFSEILLEGLAPDGGLYLPAHYPQVDAATLARWRRLGYAELAFEILSLYIDDIPPSDLRDLVQRTYTAEIFGSPQITPLKPLDDGLYLQALSNGPTLAFKDMAMQLLGNLFEYELARRGETLNILGATHLAMRRAVAALPLRADHVFVDGLPVAGFPCPSTAIIQGDAKSFLIAAASVVAKVLRDRHMEELAARYPQYGFASNKGYGVREHIAALFRHGPCPQHRRSFRPVQDALQFLPGLVE